MCVPIIRKVPRPQPLWSCVLTRSTMAVGSSWKTIPHFNSTHSHRLWRVFTNVSNCIVKCVSLLGEMEPTLFGVTTVSPEECTLNVSDSACQALIVQLYVISITLVTWQGKKRMLITFYDGTQLPSNNILAVFRGSESTHSVRAEPLNSLTYTVLIPGKLYMVIMKNV